MTASSVTQGGAGISIEKGSFLLSLQHLTQIYNSFGLYTISH